jgi:hypothetical protein
MDLSQHAPLPPMSRRDMLRRSCAGFGGMALASLVGDSTAATAASSSPLAARAPHFAPKAKRVIYLFMHGGPAQMDTFDYKPTLNQYDNKPLPIEKPRVQFQETGNILGSRFAFKQHGESGQWVSELFPNIAKCVDDMCFVKSMHGSNPSHAPAILKMVSGSDQFVRPVMGSWLSYGLGTENASLPSFITISPSAQQGGARNYSSAFLPAAHNGTPIGSMAMKAGEATIAHLNNKQLPRDMQLKQLELLHAWQSAQLESTGPDRELEGRIQSFELAFNMQTEAPDVMNIAGESEATKKLYGLDVSETSEFGYRCLLARRFSESGVRFVQATHGNDVKWDHHSGLYEGLTRSANEIDKPIAGLLKDLKSRGLLDETLVLWGGEFGRTPGSEGRDRNGRDHNPHGFTVFMAGGGIKPGFSYGETDDFGYYAAVNKVHIHDLHATMLHCLGLDHERLIYRHQGRDFRLTDVAGHVVRDILA